MGIYYNSNETRMRNLLRMADLTMADMTVIDPRLCLCLRNFGKKCYYAILNQLALEGREPGTWNDNDLSIYDHKKLAYYKEHRDEIQKDYPVQPKRKAHTESRTESCTESFDWSAFRRETAKEILMLLLKVECTGNSAYPDPEEVGGMAALYVDSLIKNLKERTE